MQNRPRERPNKRLQLTAFGARDRGFFEFILCRAPRRQLKRKTLGRRHRSHPSDQTDLVPVVIASRAARLVL